MAIVSTWQIGERTCCCSVDLVGIVNIVTSDGAVLVETDYIVVWRSHYWAGVACKQGGESAAATLGDIHRVGFGWVATNIEVVIFDAKSICKVSGLAVEPKASIIAEYWRAYWDACCGSVQSIIQDIGVDCIACVCITTCCWRCQFDDIPVW